MAAHTPAGEADRLTPGAVIRLRAAFTISSIGDWVYRFAVPVLVLRLTGSPLATAFTYVVELVPYVVIGPFAGLVADRLPRRRIMILCDSASAVVAALPALLARADHPPIAALYAVALLLACIRPFYFPTLPVWGAIVAGAGIDGAAFALVVVRWFTSLQRIIPAELSAGSSRWAGASPTPRSGQAPCSAQSSWTPPGPCAPYSWLPSPSNSSSRSAPCAPPSPESPPPIPRGTTSEGARWC